MLRGSCGQKTVSSGESRCNLTVRHGGGNAIAVWCFVWRCDLLLLGQRARRRTLWYCILYRLWKIWRMTRQWRTWWWLRCIDYRRRCSGRRCDVIASCLCAWCSRRIRRWDGRGNLRNNGRWLAMNGRGSWVANRSCLFLRRCLSHSSKVCLIVA